MLAGSCLFWKATNMSKKETRTKRAARFANIRGGLREREARSNPSLSIHNKYRLNCLKNYKTAEAASLLASLYFFA